MHTKNMMERIGIATKIHIEFNPTNQPPSCVLAVDNIRVLDEYNHIGKFEGTNMCPSEINIKSTSSDTPGSKQSNPT